MNAWWLVFALAAGLVVLGSPERSVLELTFAGLYAIFLVMWATSIARAGR